jgi:Flp pilus assembly protein TadG
MPTRKLSRIRDSRGQSLVETALMIPLLLVLILNAVNFGYFLLVTLNLTSAARSGIEYAIQGSSTPSNSALPGAGSKTNVGAVGSLIYQELTGSLNAPSGVQVQVCSLSLGNNASGQSSCQTCTNTGCTTVAGTTADADPEPGQGFVLNRVDVTYTFNTLIPTAPFNLVVGALPVCKANGSCRFARHAEMRAMGS